MAEGTGERTYQAGSLVYNKRSLTKLFVWLLLGDFSMSVMAITLAKLLPLHLEALGTQPGQIGWMLSLGPLCSLLLSPFIGVWSDRLRTKWGRRRPFLIISTPILAGGLLLIPHLTNLTILTVVILIVQVANVIETVVLYLYADVVPSRLMGRFMAGFKVVGILGGLAFTTLLFPIFDVAPTLVWTISALVYLVLYQLSLHMVREGKYDPPVEETKVQIVKDYVKDGLGSRYIWLLWLSLGMCALATPGGYFIDIFSKTELGLDMKTIAHINAWAMVPTLLIMIPGGWIMDKFGPRIIWSIFCFFHGVVLLAGYFWVKDAFTMQVFQVALAIVTSIHLLALMPMLYAHLPVAKFGQLTSMQSVIVQSMIFVSANVLGQIIQYLGNDYRFAILYGVPFFFLIPIFVHLLGRTPSPFQGMATAMDAHGGAKPLSAAH